MKKLLMMSISIFAIFTCMNCSKKSFPTIVYNYFIIQDNFDSAKSIANTNNKNIFLLIHADWCSACNTFKKDILNNESTKTLITNKIVMSMIDGDKTYGKPIATKYNVSGFPTLLVLDSDGEILARKNGGLTLSEFTNWITPYLK